MGSHSALDICRGAKDLGFSTLVIAQKGREQTYSRYYASKGSIGCVDSCLILDDFSELLKEQVQRTLRAKNVIFIPHRSFEVYLHFNYDSIENLFHIPIFGNRFLLRIEERGSRPNQYDVLEKAQIPYPEQYTDPSTIDRLCLVKVLEHTRKFERAFFLVQNKREYNEKVKEGLRLKLFDKAQIDHAVIEEFVVGTPVNFHFFYSVVSKRLELLGTDMRRQTNIEAFSKIPAKFQDNVLSTIPMKYEEVGHIAVTVLESLLEDAFAMGERFVTATKSFCPPGIIGPFSLQTIITPGPPKKIYSWLMYLPVCPALRV